MLVFRPVPLSLIVENGHLILMNIFLAAALNVVRAFFIEAVAAVGFVLACRVKDIIIVVAGAVLFAEHISVNQIIGFSCQVVGVFLYTQVGVNPKLYEGGIISASRRIVKRASGKPVTVGGAIEDYGSADRNPA
eukprot:CAMPEP_0194511388 /NCGR_PEP_ID=MMETSP0253-20130528/43049_1 /TAXON_ID=2966 /ORGANISM="Noctiluca scintillans" /LENGTH=133 /DNA_ID=CAMNT_0039354721 /DNA_START=1 /DNA_END=402 /DNA_ORIENTATION=-